jgi:hypothetical protein
LDNFIAETSHRIDQDEREKWCFDRDLLVAPFGNLNSTYHLLDEPSRLVIKRNASVKYTLSVEPISMLESDQFAVNHFFCRPPNGKGKIEQD